MPRWPWSDECAESLDGDQPIPRYRYWRRQGPPPEPILCTGGCGEDVRDLQYEVDRKPYCLRCVLKAAR